MRSVDALCFEERPDYAAMRNLLMEEVRAEADMEDGEDEVFVNLEISRPGSAGDGGPDKENCDPQVSWDFSRLPDLDSGNFCRMYRDWR